MDMIKISQRVRELRRRQGFTVEQLAVKSGLSKAFISRLENFRINPSIKALNRIAVALGVPMGEFFAIEQQSPSYVIGKLRDGEHIDRDDGNRFGIKYQALAFSKTDRKMNPFLIEYTPATEQRDYLRHGSDEFFVLLEGTIDFYIGDASDCRRMVAGDTIYLGSNLPHKVRLADGCVYAAALSIYSE